MATTSSEIDERTHLIPSQSGTCAVRNEDREGARQPQPNQTFARQLTALSAFSLLISIVIGSGVFTSPGAIDSNVPSPGAALLIWLTGGLLAWTGAMTVAELGTAIPGEGGIQPYLVKVYGEIFGFLAAWTWIAAVMPATLAILGIVFVECIFAAQGVKNESGSWLHKIISIVVVFVVSILNSISTKTSTRLGNFFVVVKLVSILLIVIAGLAVVLVHVTGQHRDVGGRDWYRHGWFNFRDTRLSNGRHLNWQHVRLWELLGHYSAALYGALWAYSGWDKVRSYKLLVLKTSEANTPHQANYIAAELSSPSRQLPLAVNTAIPTIIASFIAVNAAYYILLPWRDIPTTDSVAVVSTDCREYIYESFPKMYSRPQSNIFSEIFQH
jgi:solute carrier family 7 (L-type amino acid transporter), member 9/15